VFTALATSPAAIFGVPGATVAALGFALARERLLRGFSLLPWPSYKALEPSPFFLPRPLLFPSPLLISGELAPSL